jgi:hypothetical protein
MHHRVLLQRQFHRLGMLIFAWETVLELLLLFVPEFVIRVHRRQLFR